MGAVTDLPVPEGGAVAALPVPGDTISPEQLDIYGTRSSGGSLHRGLRSGFNSTMAGVHNLAGTFGDALGLTDFAASRFADAEQYTKFADAVGPETRDYRQVKDFDTMVDYVAGQAGQGLATSVPAFAGAALGIAAPRLVAGMGGSLRGAFGGTGGLLTRGGRAVAGGVEAAAAAKPALDATTRAMIGLGTASGVMNAGEQAGNIRALPGTPMEKLGHSLAVGGINAGLEVAGGAPGQAVRQVMKGSVKGVAKQVGKAVVGEGLTEGAQEAVGLADQSILDPNRNTAEDVPQVINAGLGGAVGGGAIGAGGKLASLAPNAAGAGYDKVEQLFNRKPKLVDSNDPAELEKAAKGDGDPEELVSSLEKGEESGLQKVWDRVKDNEAYKKFASWKEDLPTREEFKGAAQKWAKDTFDTPRNREALKSATDFVKGVRDGMKGEERHSLGRTTKDVKVRDFVLAQLDPSVREGMTADELAEHADNMKHFALHGFGRRSEVEGPGAPQTRRQFERPAETKYGEYLDAGHEADARLSDLAATDAVRSAKPSTYEGGRDTTQDTMPEGLLRMHPKNLVKTIQGIQKLYSQDGLPVAQQRGKGYEKLVKENTMRAVRGRHDAVEQAIIKHLPEDVLQSPAKRDEYVRGFISMLGDTRDGHAERLNEAAQMMFASPADAVRDIEAAIGNRDATARQFALSRDEVDQVEQEADDSEGGVQEVPDDGEPGGHEITRDPYTDARINNKDGSPAVYKSVTDAAHAIEGMKGEYDGRKTRFDTKEIVEEHYDEENDRFYETPTGKYTIQAVDRESSDDALSEAEWKKLRPFNNKSGTAESVITIKTRTHPGGRKVNLLAAVKNYMETTDDPGQSESYLARSIIRAIGKVMGDPAVENKEGRVMGLTKDSMEDMTMVPGRDEDLAGASEQWDIPDKTVVWKKGLTWGEVKKMARKNSVEVEKEYWKDIVQQLDDQLEKAMREGRVYPAKKDGTFSNRASEYAYVKANKAVDDEGRRDYNRFVRTFAREQEEWKSGFFSGDAVMGVKAQEDKDGPADTSEIVRVKDKPRYVDEQGELTDGKSQRRATGRGFLPSEVGQSPEDRANPGWDTTAIQPGAEPMKVTKGAEAFVGPAAPLPKKAAEKVDRGLNQPANEMNALPINAEAAKARAFDKLRGNLKEAGAKLNPDQEPVPRKPTVAEKQDVERATEDLRNKLKEAADKQEYARRAGKNEHRKSLMSARVYQEVGGDSGGGFAAAHDSPIKHEGKFDWRKNLGRGEGNAAFGAGTYLSTAEGVHKSYKGAFSASYGVSTRARLEQDVANLEDVVADAKLILDINNYDVTDDLAELSDAAVGRMATGRYEREYLMFSKTGYTQDGKTRRGWSIVRIDPPEPGDSYNDPSFDTFEEALNHFAPKEARLDSQMEKLAAAEKQLAALPPDKGTITSRASPTYHVTVRATPDEILDWDKPLSEQSKGVQEKLKEFAPKFTLRLVKQGLYERSDGLKFVIEQDTSRGAKMGEVRVTENGENLGSFRNLEAAKDSISGGRDMTGEKMYYQVVAKSDAKSDVKGKFVRASDYLQSLGIVGHRYAASGGRQDKFPNYVIYDDSRIETKFVEFSQASVGAGAATPEEQAKILKYLDDVLGSKLDAAFANLTHAGEWSKVNGQERIRIALGALDRWGAAYHESAHGLVSRLMESDKKTAQTLLAAAGSPQVSSKLRELLAGEPAALAQLSDPHERVAYMYQFWASGQLKSLGPKATTVMEKIKAFFLKVSQFWTEQYSDIRNVDKALEVFELFRKGELQNRDTVAEVLRDKTRTFLDKASDAMGSTWNTLDRVLSTSDGFVRGMNVPAFSAMADKVFSHAGAQGVGPGFNQAKHVAQNNFLNKLNRAVKDTTEAQQREALEELQGGAAAKSPEAKRLVANTRALLDEAFNYMQNKNVKAVTWNRSTRKYEEFDIRHVPNYFPRYYDKEKIAADRQGFVAMLIKNKVDQDEANEIADKLQKSSPVDPAENDDLVGLTYFAPNTQQRKLNIPASELAPWLRKDLYGQLASYFNYAARRGEYASRFGNQGQEFEKAIKTAVDDQGASEQQVKDFRQAVQAWEGSLGHDISPTMKKAFGALVTYQNVRLLPLAIFSSLVDPIGVAVRGGDASEAFGAFARGIRDMFKENQDDRTYKLAEAVGSITTSHDAHMIADAYGSQYMTGTQRWINEQFFKYNGMEQWNRSMRVHATGAAERFIITHVQGKSPHSARYLAELNLTPADVQFNNGELVLTAKVRDAINLWVDGAVIRPNSSLRPIWMSDPHFMLISHLKQFTYSFQKVIIARVVHEAANGNYHPAMALASYVPFIVAADVMRAMLTPGGGDDDRLKKMDLADMVWRGTQRAGLWGPGQYALDAYGDAAHAKAMGASVAGPTLQQMYDMIHATTASGGGIGPELAKAIPGHILVR